MNEANKPMRVSSLQTAMRMAVASSGIKKKLTCHTLRHSSHLLEDGVSIRQLGQHLGHSTLQSTLISLHVTEVSESKGREVRKRLLSYLLGA